MAMKQLTRTMTVLTLSWAFAHGSAMAIGDSGGNACAGTLNAPELMAAATRGTRDQFLTALREFARTQLERQESYRIAAGRRWWRDLIYGPEKARAISDAEVDAAVRAIVVQGLCNASGAKLLDYSASAGNLQATLLLLDLGSDPEALDPAAAETTLFARCVRVSSPNLEGRSQVYRLLVERGARLNRAGKSPLLTCRDPAAVALMLDMGAKVGAAEANPVDHWAHKVAVTQYRDDLDVLRVHADRPSADRALSRRTEWTICAECSGTSSRPGLCDELSKLVQPRDRRIFESKGFSGPGRSPLQTARCTAITAYEEGGSDWWKYVDQNGDPIQQAPSRGR